MMADTPNPAPFDPPLPPARGSASELYRLDLVLFAQLTGLSLSITAGQWRALGRIYVENVEWTIIGYGQRPWVAVEQAYQDACRKRDQAAAAKAE